MAVVEFRMMSNQGARVEMIMRLAFSWIRPEFLALRYYTVYHASNRYMTEAEYLDLVHGRR